MSLASLPMYDLPELAEATRDLWRGLAAHFRAAGIDDVPDHLLASPSLPAHWVSSDLLFSQTCGYPLRNTIRGRVRLLATPCYEAPGCEGSEYCSFVMVRADRNFRTLADLRGTRVAVNDRDSQSGHNALRFHVAPLARGGRFFAEAVITGSHAASLEAVAAGAADVAAVDCVSFALLARYRTTAVRELRELCRTRSAPCLPFITAGRCELDRLGRLRESLRKAMADQRLAATRERLLLRDIMLLPDSAYECIDDMEQAALGLGYPSIVEEHQTAEAP
jgi:ABC-type phosphate/phosphonate transport system substrate-binding protein